MLIDNFRAFFGKHRLDLKDLSSFWQILTEHFNPYVLSMYSDRACPVNDPYLRGSELW